MKKIKYLALTFILSTLVACKFTSSPEVAPVDTVKIDTVSVDTTVTTDTIKTDTTIR